MESKNHHTPEGAVASGAVLETSTEAFSGLTAVTPPAISTQAINVQIVLSRVHALCEALTGQIDQLSFDDNGNRHAGGNIDALNALVAEQVSKALGLCEEIEIAARAKERADG